MVKGIGVDIVENRRFDGKELPFLRKIFTDYEISISPEAGRSEYFASRFASKEAFVKALGTGFAAIRPSDIEIREDDSGKPYIALNEKLEGFLSASSVFLSITHERAFSVAMVVIDGES